MVKAEKKQAEVPAVSAEQLAKALSEAGFQLFRQRTGMPLNQAQRNLEGRTHYVDDKTLSSFVAKVHSVHVSEDGLLLAMVESVQAGPNAASGRVYRPVFFDIFGNTVYRPSIDDSHSTLAAANKDLWQQLEEIDPIKATLEGLEAKAKAVQAEADKLDSLLEELK